MLWALIRITEGNLYFGHETSLSQCLFLPKQRASVVNEEKKHEKFSCFFLRLQGKRRQMLASPRREIHTLPLRVSFLTRISTRPEKDTERKQHLFCFYFFLLFFDLTAADISVSSQGTKNLSFSNNLLIFPEEHADMHV